MTTSSAPGQEPARTAALRGRWRAGSRRVRVSLPKIVLATIGSVFSYWFAETVLGHTGPIFAATSALISLNFAANSYVRRTLEVAIGCTLGVALGDLLLSLFGHGLWQGALVVFVSLVVARFLDPGVTFSMQFGVQSLLVVMLPAQPGGPFARSIDAVVGGLVAMTLIALWPRDPRRAPAATLSRLLRELGAILRDLSSAVVADDSPGAWHALIRARGTQPLVDAAATELTEAEELARILPRARRHRGDVGELRAVSKQADLAVRNARMTARRTASLLSHGELEPAARDEIASLFDSLADGCALLGGAAQETSAGARHRLQRRARETFAGAAARMNPARLGGTDAQRTGLVMMLRPLCVDLLEATGLPHDAAVDLLADVGGAPENGEPA